ncbi:LolA family protein [Pseudogracilibacillus sp. SO30301A]|uniref:LolA family protein n=1 Tax=Pseudogracilibacillus sp. SO30301A TaxID=3098291 RepID=UPI00300E3A08
MKKAIFALIGLSSLFVVGCSNMNQYSPEQVFSNALETDNGTSYYGEMEMSIVGMGENETSFLKEWRQNERSRVEMEVDGGRVIAINDGKSLIVYEEKEKKAFSFEAGEIQELHMNPKEQVEMLLEMIQDTHDIQNVGEEEVNGRSTFHMVAQKQKDKKSLYDDQEIWIDKEHWVVLKMNSASGDVQINTEYKKIDFNAKIDESRFQLDLPEDVEIESFDDFDEEEEITLTDIPEKMNNPSVLHIPNTEEHEVDKISFIEIEGDPSYQDVTIDYKRNGLPLMTLTIFTADEETEDTKDIFAAGFEKETIRGEEGVYIDVEDLHFISWSEGGLSYSIEIIDPNVTLDMVKQWAEEMEEIK